MPKNVVRGLRSQEIAVTARACGPNAPGLVPWVHGGEARRPPEGWTVHGERALKTPGRVKKGLMCSHAPSSSTASKKSRVVNVMNYSMKDMATSH